MIQFVPVGKREEERPFFPSELTLRQEYYYTYTAAMLVADVDPIGELKRQIRLSYGFLCLVRTSSC